jgi:hypothetical protein
MKEMCGRQLTGEITFGLKCKNPLPVFMLGLSTACGYNTTFVCAGCSTWASVPGHWWKAMEH